MIRAAGPSAVFAVNGAPALTAYQPAPVSPRITGMVIRLRRVGSRLGLPELFCRTWDGINILIKPRRTAPNADSLATLCYLQDRGQTPHRQSRFPLGTAAPRSDIGRSVPPLRLIPARPARCAEFLFVRRTGQVPRHDFCPRGRSSGTINLWCALTKGTRAFSLMY